MRRVLVALVAICLFLSLEQAQAQQTQSQPSWTSNSAATADAKHAQSAAPTCTNNGTYKNKQGQIVPRPENCSAVPEGASAQCRDGAYSFSRNRRGTCSHHGGVAKWL
jgi:hypothetical protein